MSTRAAKTRPVDPLWPVLMAAEGLCVVAEADGSWRAVYGVTVPEGSLPFPVPRVIGHCGCPLGAAVVAMERTVRELAQGRGGLVLSAGSEGGMGAGSPQPRGEKP